MGQAVETETFPMMQHKARECQMSLPNFMRATEDIIQLFISDKLTTNIYV